jgi:hypothetical protein
MSEIIEAVWRSTGMGGCTHPVALKRSGNKLEVIQPRRKIYSKSHSHGTWLYKRSDVDVLLFLEISNSGRPSVALSICDLPEEQCKKIYDTAYNAWVLDDAYTDEVERLLESLDLES